MSSVAPLIIASWNINGIRAAVSKGLMRKLPQLKASVIGLQEVRCGRDELPASLTKSKAWKGYYVSAQRKGYSGVGLLSKLDIQTIETELGHPEIDAEGRLQIARVGQLTLVNGYFPNGSGKERDNSRVPFKLTFYKLLQERLRRQLEAGDPVLVIGDFNTAHTELDLARPKQNRKTSGFLPEESAEFQSWLDDGWVDTFRHFSKEPAHYTWWSQRPGVREKNIGWRIDYCLASPGLMPYLKAARIHPLITGSDHCPISVELDRTVLTSGASV